MAKKAKKAKKATAAPELDWRAYMAEIERKQKEARQNALLEVKQIAVELHLKGVTSVRCIYSGEGDSGQMDYVEYDKNSAFGPKKPNDLSDAQREALENMAWQFIPSGFENNDGGEGVVEFDLVKQTIHVQHSDRIVEVTTDEREELYNFDGETV